MNIFDGHTDIMADVVLRRNNGEENVFRAYHLDKVRAGQVTGANFMLWLDPENSTWDDVTMGMQQIQEELKQTTDILFPVKRLEDLKPEANEGKIAVVLGMEGLSAMGPAVERIDWLYEQGVRCAGLTWNESNALATGIAGDQDRGLTKEGVQVVKRMESLGMLLDVSHLNETSFWDVVKVASKPFMASHSNARSLCDHPRNLKDEQLKAIRNVGGLVGINAVADFLHPAEPGLTHFIEQIEYMVNLLGIDHVALGFDFCDFLHLDQEKEPNDIHVTTSLETSRDSQNAIKALIKRGFSHEDMLKLTRDNFLRLYGFHLI